MLFVDDFSRFTWIFPLKNKSDVFKDFESFVKTQFQCQIKSFHSDWGGEFQKLHPYLKQQGIVHRITCPYTHEQNGLAERKISHIIDTDLTLLAHAFIPFKYWSYAFLHAVLTINQMPNTSLKNKIPFEILYNKSPDYIESKVFGCTVYPYLRPYNKNKFSFCTYQCVYLGHSPTHHGNLCLDVAKN